MQVASSWKAYWCLPRFEKRITKRRDISRCIYLIISNPKATHEKYKKTKPTVECQYTFSVQYSTFFTDTHSAHSKPRIVSSDLVASFIIYISNALFLKTSLKSLHRSEKLVVLQGKAKLHGCIGIGCELDSASSGSCACCFGDVFYSTFSKSSIFRSILPGWSTPWVGAVALVSLARFLFSSLETWIPTWPSASPTPSGSGDSSKVNSMSTFTELWSFNIISVSEGRPYALFLLVVAADFLTPRSSFRQHLQSRPMVSGKKTQSIARHEMIAHSSISLLSVRLNRQSGFFQNSSVLVFIVGLFMIWSVGGLSEFLVDDLGVVACTEAFVKVGVEFWDVVVTLWAFSPSRLTSRMKHTKWYILEYVRNLKRNWEKGVSKWVTPWKTLHEVEFSIMYPFTMHRISWTEIWISLAWVAFNTTYQLCLWSTSFNT